MSALKAMHVAKRELGLDDDDYRVVLRRVTGKNSAKEMTTVEQHRCMAEFRRLGFADKRGLDGPYAKKLQALWLSAWHLGIVRNRDDAALSAFVERQTGIPRVRWLRDGYSASRAIDGLKAWIAREAGVVWPSSSDPIALKRAVIDAQRRLLGWGPGGCDDVSGPATVLNETIAELGDQIRSRS